MPGAKVIKPKTKESKDKLKAEQKKKNVITKIKDKFFGGGKAKAAIPKIKKKPLSPAQKKKSAAVQKAEDARRKRQKDNMKKDAAKAHYSSVPGYKGKAGGQNTKSKSYRERLADQKKKAAKKASDAKAADTRDAKRGGFITAKAAKTAGRKANEKVAANKKRRSDELVSRNKRQHG